MNIGNLKKWGTTILIVLMIIALGTAVGYFTARAIAHFRAETSTLVTSIQNTDGVRLNVSVNDDEYFYPGQGREIQYSVKNQGITASDNKDTLVFTFTDPDGNAIAVSKDNAPVQLYRAEDVVLDPDTMEYTVKEGATPITIKYSAGNTLTYEFEYSLDGNNDLEEYQDIGIGTDTVIQNFVLVFDSQFADAKDFAEATITMNLATSSKIYDRWLTRWDDQETYSTSTIMNVRDGEKYICSVYSTDGTYIGSYKSLKKGFEVAEQTAIADAEMLAGISLFYSNQDATSGNPQAPGFNPYDFSAMVHVRVEMLIDNYKVKQPITLTTPYLITLSSNVEAMELEGVTGKFTLKNSCLGAMITAPEDTKLRLENIKVDGDATESNVVANYGTLYTTAQSELTNTAAPAIYNGTSGVIYTDGINIYDCHADLGAAIYSCGMICMRGNNQIDGSNGADAQPSNVYLATEDAAIWVLEGFNLNSDVHVSAAVFFDKTMVYTLDPDRYNSDYTANFTFERQDILDVAGYQTWYYDAEFYMDKPFQFVFDDEKMVYYPTSDNRVSNTHCDSSMPRLANWSAYMLKDGTPCDADTPGAYKMEAIYGNYNFVAHSTCLREVWVPETVTTVEANAFQDCWNLSRVYWLPQTVNTYEGWGGYFAGCDKLKIVTTQLGCTPTNGDQNNTIYMNPQSTKIPFLMFAQMPALELLDLTGSSITKIQEAAVQNCPALEEIILSEEVVTIGKGAFSGDTNLQYFNCTDTITTIDSYAFQGCESLQTVYIGSGITFMGMNVFDSCVELDKVYWNTSYPGAAKGGSFFTNCPQLLYVTDADIDNAIVISPNVTYLADAICMNSTIQTVDLSNTSVATIGKNAFNNCDALTSVVTGTALRTIKESAFYDCDILTTANIQSGTTVIGFTAFYSCDVLHDLTLPDTLQHLAGAAFGYCTTLETVTIPESLTKIENSAFAHCTSLHKVYWNAVSCASSDKFSWYADRAVFGYDTLLKHITAEDIDNAVVIGPNVKVLPTSIFAQMSALTDVDLTETQITHISSNCFHNDTALVDVKLPETLLSIGSGAFSYCTILPEITIPESVTNIGNSAFHTCTSLHKVYWNAINCDNADNSPWHADRAVFGNDTLLKHVTAENIDNAVIIGPNVQVLPTAIFAQMPALTDVDLTGTQVDTISAFCFHNDTALVDVELSDTLTTIGGSSFSYCTALPVVTIPENVTKIHNGAFYNCTALSKVYWNAINCVNPENYAWYKDRAVFSYDTLLQHVTAEDIDNAIVIGTNVETLPYAIFAQLPSLADADFSNTQITVVPGYCFTSDAALIDVTLHADTTVINGWAFSQCTALPEITIPESLAAIHNSAFRDCKALSKVYWNAINCTNPDSLAWYNDNSVFAYTTSLKHVSTEDADNTVVIGENVETLPYALFAYMSSLTDVNLKDTKLTVVPNYLCWGSPALTNVSLPKNISHLGEQAFMSCTSLTSIALDTQSASLYSNTFPAPFTIYCTGPDDCITGANAAWTIYYRCLTLDDVVVDENGVIQELVGERWNKDTIDLTNTQYIDAEGNLKPITGFDTGILSGLTGTKLIMPAFYTAEQFDIALLTNCATLTEVVFNGTGYATYAGEIYSNTAIQTIRYNDATGNKVETHRPTVGYTADANGIITAIDASVATGNTYVMPDTVWYIKDNGECVAATGIASGAMSKLSATNITVPMSISSVALDAFPANLTELTILNTAVNTKSFRVAMFVAYENLTVIHGAVADFTMLESVTSSGGNWLDTGIYGSEKLNIETSYIQHQNNSGYQALFGARAGSTYRVYGFFGIFGGNTSTTKVFAYRYKEIRSTFANTFFDTPQHLKTDGATAYVTINGETVAIVGENGTFTTPKTIYLWCMNQNGSAVDYAKVTMQYFRMWENGTLVREFVPALDPNGVVCMYDIVTGKFFYCNTGELIGGAEVAANPYYTVQDFTRPAEGYTITEDGVITAIDSAAVSGGTLVIPENVYILDANGDAIYGTSIASGALSGLNVTSVTVPFSIKSVAVDAFPAGLTELTIHNNAINTEEFRNAMFAVYPNLTVIHGAVGDFVILDSLTNSGSNWVDTGIKGSNNINVETSFIQHQNGNAYQCLFGSRYNPSNQAYGWFGIYAGNNSVTKSFTFNNIEAKATFASTYFDVVQHLKTDGASAYITIDGQTTTITGNAGTFTSPCNMYLFAMNNKGTVQDNAKATMHYFKIWDNGTLVRDFVPAIDTNGVVCFYDFVTGEFFYPNSGEFTAGEVANVANPNYTIQDFTRP